MGWKAITSIGAFLLVLVIVPGFGEVQTGEQNFDGVQINFTIQPTDSTKAFSLYEINHPTYDVADGLQFTPNFESDTILSWNRYFGVSNTDLYSQIIDSLNFTVQHSSAYTFAIDETNVTIAIDEVNLTESFIITYGRCNTSTESLFHDGFFASNFTNSTSVNLRRGESGCNALAKFSVVQYQGANVQSGTVILGEPTTILNVDVNAVNMSNTVLFFDYSAPGSDDGMDSNMVRGKLFNETRIQFRRDGAPGTSNDRVITYFLVSHPDFKVQRGTYTINNGDNAINTTINPVNARKTFVYSSYEGTGGGTSWANSLAITKLYNSTMIKTDKATTSQGLITEWQVIEVLSMNSVPIQGKPFLNATTRFNSTFDNLTCHNISTWDNDGDSIKNIFNWYRNGTSIAVLNMPFEEGRNSTFTKDYSGYGNNGIVTGATWNGTGGYDGKGAYEFDSSNNESIQAGDINVTSSGKFSISFWIKIRPNSDSRPGVMEEDWASNRGFIIELKSGTTPRVWFGSVAATATTVLTMGEWNHIAVTYNGSLGKVYVNGINEKNASKVLDNTTTSEKVNIGYTEWGGGTEQHYLNGTMDEVMIFNYDLSDEQIKAIYENKTDMIVSQETRPTRETWYCEITPNDGFFDGSTNQSNNITIILANILPTQTTPILNSSRGRNFTIENLTCHNQSTFDAEGQPVKNIYNYFLNDVTFPLLNVPFEQSSVDFFTKDYAGTKDGVVFNAVWNGTGGYDGFGAFELQGNVGVKQGVEFNDTGVWNFKANGSYTYSIWFNIPQVQSFFGGLFADEVIFTNGFDVYFYDIDGTDNAIQFYDTDNGIGYVDTTTNITFGEWHHYAVTYNNETITSYYDGELEATDSIVVPFTDSTGNLIVGYSEDSGIGINGSIDDFRMYNRILNASQVKAIYENRTDLITSDVTVPFQNWSCQVTPNDGLDDGITLESVNLTVQPFFYPNITLIHPLNDALAIDLWTAFVYNVTGSLPMSNTTLILDDTINGSADTSVIRNTTSFFNRNLIEGNTYNYRINATDIWGHVRSSEARNFTVAENPIVINGSLVIRNGEFNGTLYNNSLVIRSCNW